jgi:ABC-type nitrate/sulfonate/bicarbonate transport system permease component
MGFVIGTSMALVLGCLIGWYKFVEYIFDPLIEAVRPIPPLAYIPIIIIWFGIEEFSRVLLITIACFLVCIVNVIAGMKNVPQVYVDAAATMGASRFQIFRTVAIPAATPFIFTGFRIALAASWTTLVAAELIAAPSGLGYLLQEGRRYFLTDQVMMIIVIIGICAFTMDRLFRTIQARLTRWSEARE